MARQNPAPRGYLPCFSKHKDKLYPIEEFYANRTFVNKIANFLQVIVTLDDVYKLREHMSIKNSPSKIDSTNKQDREVIGRLGWGGNHIYKLDFGNVKYRLYFGLEQGRCYILGLDTNHKTNR